MYNCQDSLRKMILTFLSTMPHTTMLAHVAISLSLYIVFVSSFMSDRVNRRYAAYSIDYSKLLTKLSSPLFYTLLQLKEVIHIQVHPSLTLVSPILVKLTLVEVMVDSSPASSPFSSPVVSYHSLSLMAVTLLLHSTWCRIPS